MSSKHFLIANKKLLEKNMWLKAKSKANLKPESRRKVFWNNCWQRCFTWHKASQILLLLLLLLLLLMFI